MLGCAGGGGGVLLSVLQRENEGLRAQLLGCQHQQAEECSALVAQLAALQAEHTATQHVCHSHSRGGGRGASKVHTHHPQKRSSESLFYFQTPATVCD